MEAALSVAILNAVLYSHYNVIVNQALQILYERGVIKKRLEGEIKRK
jgi:hypothetical protein